MLKMQYIDLIREQIKLECPKSIMDYSASGRIVYINIEPFGELSMDEKFNIEITFKKAYTGDFNCFKMYFEGRLKFENATAYVYKDHISIFARIGNDRSRSKFENSMIRANNFIKTARIIEEFIKYNI